MHMSVDHVADRLGRPRTDRGQQPAALARAAAGIDHRNGVVADDESDVGNGAFVVAAHERQGADVNEDAGATSDTASGAGLPWRGQQQSARWARAPERVAANDLPAASMTVAATPTIRLRMRLPFAAADTSELHYPISMDHNRREYLAGVPVPPVMRNSASSVRLSRIFLLRSVRGEHRLSPRFPASRTSGSKGIRRFFES